MALEYNAHYLVHNTPLVFVVIYPPIRHVWPKRGAMSCKRIYDTGVVSYIYPTAEPIRLSEPIYLSSNRLHRVSRYIIGLPGLQISWCNPWR